MKKIVVLLLSAFVWVTVGAQENNIRISGDAGVVTNTGRDKKFGMGGSLGWLTVDNLISRSNTNYFALHIKGFNNPYGEGKLISSILNDKNDGFTYIMPLIGYRFTQRGMSNGFFAEPRIGMAFGANKYTAFALSPLAGYAYEGFEFSLFCDIGFGQKNNAILKRNFFTPGIGVAYNITIY